MIASRESGASKPCVGQVRQNVPQKSSGSRNNSDESFNEHSGSNDVDKVQSNTQVQSCNFQSIKLTISPSKDRNHSPDKDLADTYDSILEQQSLNRLIKDFVYRKAEYDRLLAKQEHIARFSNSINSSELGTMTQVDLPPKPRLQDFMAAFDEKVKDINMLYKESKAQFENDMKHFKDSDIEKEEELIEKSINEGGKALRQSMCLSPVPGDLFLHDRFNS